MKEADIWRNERNERRRGGLREKESEDAGDYNRAVRVFIHGASLWSYWQSGASSV